MKCQGTLKTISLDYITHRPQITVEVDAELEDLEKLTDRKLSVELTQYREHRSLEANSYFWVLCTQIAEAIDQTVSYVHNALLRRYGQVEQVDGETVYVVIPDTDEAATAAEEADTYHLKPTSEVKEGTDGKMYRTYILLKGSHEYDTKEMSRLIDGTVKEANALGISTITENEQRRMMEVYGKKYSARSERT